MVQKVNESLNILDETIKVEDDILNIKMKELQDKVQMLVYRMNMLRTKYSTTSIVATNMTNHVPSLVKSENIEDTKLVVQTCLM